jgi:hypothetical protein
MTTSYIGSVLDDITDGLAARSGLQDVHVFSGPVSIEEAGTECIAFGDARLTDSMVAMGSVKEETWEVDGELYVVGVWQGDTEATIRASRDRILELFAEVESYINDTYLGEFPDAEVTAGELQQNIAAEGRACRMTFNLTVLGIKNP